MSLPNDLLMRWLSNTATQSLLGNGGARPKRYLSGDLSVSVSMHNSLYFVRWLAFDTEALSYVVVRGRYPRDPGPFQ